jgi:hypothetical protein
VVLAPSFPACDYLPSCEVVDVGDGVGGPQIQSRVGRATFLLSLGTRGEGGLGGGWFAITSLVVVVVVEGF